LLGELNLHIPNVQNHERDARSKLAIVDSDSKVVKPISPKLGVDFHRYRRLYQCQSGTDHTTGHHAATKRNRPWENVGCSFWAKMVTTQLRIPSGDGNQTEEGT
jgi:hypothetical protein